MKKFVKIILCVLAVLIIAAGGVLAFATILEYRPADTLDIPVTRSAADDARVPSQDDTLTVLSWNLGYGCLGDNADFFMDGGKGVNTADRTRLGSNLDQIAQSVQAQNADLILLQEIDRDSSRSHHTDETAFMAGALSGYDHTFANNFKAAFVPYPIPPIGKVDSGLMTLSAFPIREAARLSLPCPFSWPVRTVNLKRCLAVNRIPTAQDGCELVLINLHLEAYDSGEGKIAQTGMLSRIIQEERDAGNYVIAGGDFNQTFREEFRNAYPIQEGKWAPGMIDQSVFSDGWQFLMDPETPTCRSLDQPYAGADRENFQYYVIDGFIVSDNIEVLSCETLDEGFEATDHNPVLLKVRLK